jgi:hypothetical protein
MTIWKQSHRGGIKQDTGMPNGEMDFEQLRITYQQHLRDFIQVEIELGLTFAEFARLERDCGNVEHFRQARFDAETAVSSVRRFLPRLSDPEAQAAAVERLEKLSQTVSDL